MSGTTVGATPASAPLTLKFSHALAEALRQARELVAEPCFIGSQRDRLQTIVDLLEHCTAKSLPLPIASSESARPAPP